MDSKKLAFSGQLLSPRRKVVSRFGLGLAASVILLTLIFLNNSYKSPLVTPLFQGFSSVGVNSTRVVSWPFSFSTSPLNDSSSSNGIEQVKSFFDTESNVSSVDNRKEKVLENTHLGNSTWKGKDGNLSAKGGIQLKSHEVYNNGSSVSKRGTFSNPNVADVVVDNLCRGNFSEVVHIGTLPGEKGQNCGNISSVNNVSDVNSQVSDSKNVSRLSQDQGNSADKNSSTSGSDYDSQLMKTQGSLYENCDIFDGRWVRDESKPYYPPGSCPFIDRDFDCHLNRRPDDGFLKWRWQPNGCDIPSLNAADFLERLRGKKLVFVGDSLNRNMWESLVCILRHSVKNKKRVYEISGRTEFKKKGFYAFHFKDYNCTVDFVGSPFLVRESSYKGRNGSFETLRLDLMDRTTSMYHDADIIIFNTGHWWTHEKTSKGEDYYQEGNQVYPRLKVLEAYKRALSTWARWVDKNIDSSRTQVFFRGYSVTHFRGGQWNSGGQCHKETEPISSGTHLKKYPSKMRALEHVLQEMKTPIVYLNISRLTDYRKDGHPSIYRKIYKTEAERVAAEQAQDCSHWCLPGVPDTWNELLYASLLKLGMGSVRN